MQVDLVPAILNQPVSHGRSEGVHLSGIIRSIAVATKILTPDQCDDLSLVDANQQEWWENLAPVDKLRISIGLAWEAWYIPQIGNVVDHPGEMQLQGIYMTHDGESIDSVWTGDTELTLHEVKATYKSIKTVEGKEPEEWLRSQWMWLTQLKGYCKGLGIRVAFLHVLFLCGDYSYPIRPVLKVYKVTFEQDEIDETWELLTDYMDFRQTISEGTEP